MTQAVSRADNDLGTPNQYNLNLQLNNTSHSQLPNRGHFLNTSSHLMYQSQKRNSDSIQMKGNSSIRTLIRLANSRNDGLKVNSSTTNNNTNL